MVCSKLRVRGVATFSPALHPGATRSKSQTAPRKSAMRTTKARRIAVFRPRSEWGGGRRRQRAW